MLGQDARGDPFKKIKGQVQHVPKCPGCHPQVDLVGGMEQQVITEEIKTGVDKQHHGHAQTQHLQGCKCLVDQHLVDDNLEENRCNQGDAIDKQDSQRNIEKGHLLPQDLRHEPAQAERL